MAKEAEVEIGAYTIPEFCLVMKMSRAMVYKEAKAGKLKISKFGTLSRITRENARRYQQLCSTGTAEEPKHLKEARKKQGAEAA